MKKADFLNSISYLRIRQIFAFLSLIVFVFVMSFYYTNGYLDMGEDKFRAFKYSAEIISGIWLIIGLIDFFKEKEYLSLTGFWKKWSPCTAFMVFFIVSGIISTSVSKFKVTSFWGNEGWHLGLFTQIMMAMLYLIVYDLFHVLKKNHRQIFIGCLLVIANVTILLGFLNRFSIFPNKMRGEAEDFISTLGNINWYCGYWVIWTGIICGLFILSIKKKEKIILGYFLFSSTISGVACGSSSCYLGWMGISFAGLLLTLDHKERLRSFVQMQIIALSSLPFIRFIGFLRPHRMWYNSAMLKTITYGTGWILPFEVGIALCIIFWVLIDRYPEKMGKLKGIVIGFAIGLFLVFLLLITLNSTIQGGIWPVRGHSFFLWRDDWGNGRGGIWRYSFKIFKELPLLSKLFGVGCDCFCAYAYSCTSIKLDMYYVLGENYLTNTHNELFTILINEGVFGVIAFVGLIISHVKISICKIHKNPIMLALTLAVAGYVSVGLVGFMQILSTPLLFIVMGMIAGLNAKDS